MEYLHTVRDTLMPDKLPLDNLESWNVHKNGYAVGLLTSAKPILHQDGSLKGYRGIFKDITEAKIQDEKVKFLAYYDILTGLPNRTLFYDRLENVSKQAKKEGSVFAVMFIDLDRFKQVNDTLGHAAGDELLQKVSIRIKNCLRTTDTFARIAGDEFTVLLPNIKNNEELFEIGTRIVTALNSPLLIRGVDPGVTASIGIALYPTDGEEVNTLLKNADKAMYGAKNNGKNCFVFNDEKIEAKSRQNQTMKTIILEALGKDELKIFYQPIIAVSSGKIIGVEALLRIENPEFGLILPLDFIPILEKMNLIEKYGEWAFEKVCHQLQDWEKAGFTNLRITINLSGKQFLNHLLYDILSGIMKKRGINPASIEIELRECDFNTNDTLSLKILNKLKDDGVRISLDGFGKVHSTLGFLNKYPIHTIKIDRSIIESVGKNKGDESFLKAINLMAKGMGLKIIASGIETKEELSELIRVGCDEVQGFLFCNPEHPEIISKYLEEDKTFTV